MKILVLGAGGIGGYVGGRLLQSGADVTFLVRPARAALLAEHGLRIESPAGDATLQVRTATAETVRPEHDLVLLTCKAYDLDSAIAAISPGLAPAGAVLPMLNGMSHMDTLDHAFGPSRVLGGLVGIAVMLRADGVVHHLNNQCTLAFGDRGGAMDGRIAELAEVFAAAEGMTSRAVPDITRQMWQKLVMLGTLASMGCLMRANVGEIVGTVEGGTLFQRMLENAIDTATAHGYPPDEAALGGIRRMVSDPASTMTASMLRDLETGQRVEVDHITGFLLQSARAKGIDDTLFAAAYANLKAYERRREAGRL